MKKSVGLIVATKLPNYGEVVILQIRGEFNHENLQPESWPGGCQVTAHGGVEEKESIQEALIREAREELGEKISSVLEKEKFIKLMKKEEEENKINITYGVFLEPEFLRLIKLNPSSGGLRILKSEELGDILDLKTFDRTEGVPDRKVTAMFADEIEAVRLAFKKLFSS